MNKKNYTTKQCRDKFHKLCNLLTYLLKDTDDEKIEEVHLILRDISSNLKSKCANCRLNPAATFGIHV